MDTALFKWMSTPEAKKIATSAQEKAWKALQQQFPRADRSKFELKYKQCLRKTTPPPQKYFSKAVQPCQRAFSAQTRDIGAWK